MSKGSIVNWTMYDSTNPFDIPVAAEAVAGYVDGEFRWSDDSWARFATARKLRIATRAATNDGHALDVEQFDATPSEAPGWVRMRMAAGVHRPIIYCNRATWPDVQVTCAGLPVRWWIATLDRTTPFILAGADATQYAGSAQAGGHYDLSLCAPDFFSDVTGDPPKEVGMGGKINSAPFNPSRLDVCVVGNDGHVYRTFSDGGAGGIDARSDWFATDAEHVPAGGFFDVDWCWDALNRQCILGLANDGYVYLCVVRSTDGGYDQGWSRLQVVTAYPPSKPPTPVAVPDIPLRAALKAAVDGL